MKNLLLIAMFVSLIACTSRPATDTTQTGAAKMVALISGPEYTLSDTGSVVYWIGNKPTGQHHGTIDIIDGQLSVTGSELASGKFVLDMNSIINLDIEDKETNAKLVNHLKSPDFFYSEKYPKATFEVVSVKPIVPTGINDVGIQANNEVTGNLTLRGITKSITFPATIYIEGKFVTIVTDQFAIDRTQWGVSHMSKTLSADLKDKFVDDEIIIHFNLRFDKL